MHIIFEESGGITGTILRTEMQSEELPKKEQRFLSKLLKNYHHYKASYNSYPDVQQLCIQVTDKYSKYEFIFNALNIPKEIKPLINYLLSKASYVKN